MRHESARAGKHEWLTPPHILRALGEFDLDPCAPVVRPWPTAKEHFTADDDGLLLPWFGRVWLNPPYGNHLSAWLQKMSRHQNGVSLTFARTDTAMFHDYVFPHADSMLLLRGRLTFHHVDGTPGDYNGGAPSVLLAYGESNVDALEDSKLPGKHVLLNRVPIIVVGLSPSWQTVVRMSLTRLGNEANLNAIYEMVEKLAPEKVQRNQFHKEKIRQTLQIYFRRLSKGIYKAA